MVSSTTGVGGQSFVPVRRPDAEAGSGLRADANLPVRSDSLSQQGRSPRSSVVPDPDPLSAQRVRIPQLEELSRRDIASLPRGSLVNLVI